MINIKEIKPNDRFLRMPEVNELTGLSRAQIYSLISQEKFPRQIKLGEKASGWMLSEIHDWMRDRIEKSRGIAA